ncbi:hypothetical protein [uncultured Vagococcus sp.]|uniref:hypothetical protein n=1 Tax=uncultured Vagococcus sp. TaxID=189676 RepID=UPI0028D82432|nr:hypothetical protein [uncultured Vagococcus sp.]
MQLVGTFTRRVYLEAADKQTLLRMANHLFYYGSYQFGDGVNKVKYVYPEPLEIKGGLS